MPCWVLAEGDKGGGLIMEASTLSEDALGHEAEAQLFSLGNSLTVSGVLGW